MSASSKLQPKDLSLGAGLAAAAALGFGVMLAWLAAPAGFDERMAAAEGRLARAETLLKPPRTAARYDLAAVCDAAPDRQAETLRRTVQSEAAGNALVLVAVDARPELTQDHEGRLAPVRLRFTATGSYDGAVALLAVLGRQRPQLFVDSLDLTPRTANVTLNFSGRVFCAAS